MMKSKRNHQSFKDVYIPTPKTPVLARKLCTLANSILYMWPDQA